MRGRRPRVSGTDAARLHALGGAARGRLRLPPGGAPEALGSPRAEHERGAGRRGRGAAAVARSRDGLDDWFRPGSADGTASGTACP